MSGAVCTYTVLGALYGDCMKYLIVAISFILLSGCYSRTRLNNGADLAVYYGSTQHMSDKIPAGVYKPNAMVYGYYSPADGSITLHEQLRGLGAARVFAHELAHAYDRQKPRDLWELLARYQSVDFDFNPHKVLP